MNYIKLKFELSNDEQAEIISALLSETQYLGTELVSGNLFVYYDEHQFNEEEVIRSFSPLTISFEQSLVPQENWNAQWESNFEPIIVDHRLGIRAHFHPAFNQLDYDIIITPKMSFGTGHHATTQMMLSYLLEIPCVDQRVLDFGCGTGVLAILAKMKHAQFVLAIDNDPWCIENSKENALLNDVDIQVESTDVTALNEQFHLILANINLNILQESMSTLKQCLYPNADILLSGILLSDHDSIKELLRQNQLQYVNSKDIGEWLCIHARNV